MKTFEVKRFFSVVYFTRIGLVYIPEYHTRRLKTPPELSHNLFLALFLTYMAVGESSLTIGTGCRVEVFSLFLDSLVGLSARIQSTGD